MCSQTVGLSLLSSISGPWPAQPSSAQLTVVILPAPAPALARPGCAAVTHWRAFPVFVSLQLIQPDTTAATHRHPARLPSLPVTPSPCPLGLVMLVVMVAQCCHQWQCHPSSLIPRSRGPPYCHRPAAPAVCSLQ